MAKSKLNTKKLSARLTNTGLAVGGGAVSYFSNKIVPQSVSPKARGIGKIVIAALVPEIAPKSMALHHAMEGFAGHAGGELLSAFMPAEAVEGIGADGEFIEIPEDNLENLSGTPNDNPIQGNDVISGADVIME